MAVGLGTLALKPDARTWLRRRLGMEPEDRRWFEEDDAQPAEHEGDEPLDTREARFSLRARLAEEAGSGAEPIAAPPPRAAVPPLPPLPPLEQTPAPLAPASASTPPVAPAPEPAGGLARKSPRQLRPRRRRADAPAAAAPSARARAEDAPAATPAPAASEPAPAPAFESVPPIGPEAEEAAKTPGEDTSEIEAVPPDEAGPPPSASPPPPPPPPPPPTPLRPPTSPGSPSTSRPFSGQSASFRSAIDAARERVHGAAREATPDEGEQPSRRRRS